MVFPAHARARHQIVRAAAVIDFPLKDTIDQHFRFCARSALVVRVFVLERLAGRLGKFEVLLLGPQRAFGAKRAFDSAVGVLYERIASEAVIVGRYLVVRSAIIQGRLQLLIRLPAHGVVVHADHTPVPVGDGERQAIWRIRALLILAQLVGHHRCEPMSIVGPVPRDVVWIRASREIAIIIVEELGLTSGADERRRELQYLFERWRMLREEMADLDERIAAAVARCPEARALTTIPQVSNLCAKAIVAELGTPSTFVHPAQVLKLAGMNLVGRDSGVSVRGRRWQSKRRRPMLRRQLYLLAGRWSSSRGLLPEEYLAMVQRNGQLKTKAVCAMVRKLVPMLFEVMKSGSRSTRSVISATSGVTRPHSDPFTRADALKALLTAIQNGGLTSAIETSTE
jgi:hypothetical protein